MLKAPFSVAVVGGGPAGLTTAGYLTRAGVEVTLIEREAQLGGRLNRLGKLFGRYPDAATLRQRLLARVEQPGMRVVTQATVDGIKWVNDAYQLTVNGQTLASAAVVLATGWDHQLRLEEHGVAPAANTHALSAAAESLTRPVRELAKTWRGKRVAFVLDVSNPFSKIAAATAYRLALTLTQDLAGECYVLSRDARVAGYGLESLYGTVRRAGILVFKYEGSRPQVAQTDDDFTLRLEQPSLGRGAAVELVVDHLVLDEAIIPAAGHPALAASLGIGLARRGRAQGVFWGDDTVSLEDTGTERAGVFLSGGARAELDLEETLRSAGAAAARVLNYLHLTPEAQARVEESRCARCLTCVRLCPYQAIHIDYYRRAEKAAARISDRACRGCGTCVAACPARAIELVELADQELVMSIGGMNQ